jgi:hypothetical protein
VRHFALTGCCREKYPEGDVGRTAIDVWMNILRVWWLIGRVGYQVVTSCLCSAFFATLLGRSLSVGGAYRVGSGGHVTDQHQITLRFLPPPQGFDFLQTALISITFVDVVLMRRQHHDAVWRLI